jgi:glyoxylase-like metal-dependent hydrolase (beta-lactamase superfamily II)
MNYNIHTIDLHFQGVSESIAAFLVESQDGLVLIETGPHSSLPALEEGLSKHGATPQDISAILVTHIHLDHSGAAWAIAQAADAPVYVHPKGYPHLLDPSRLLASAQMIYGDQMDRLWGKLLPVPEKYLVSVDHGVVVRAAGLEFSAWHTPGHANHHIAWQLGDVAFTGDVAGARIQDGMIVPPCPPPDIHVPQWLDSIAQLQSLSLQAIYLTHFGRFDDVQSHLDTLRETLETWVAWMKPYALEGKPPKEVLRPFHEFIAESYNRAGMSAPLQEKYAKANPLDMNVGGLLRYWQKYGKDV